MNDIAAINEYIRVKNISLLSWLYYNYSHQMQLFGGNLKVNNIQLLDCTLRDGAYIVDSHFGKPAICGIVNKLQEARIDVIECGWLKNKEHEEGSSFFHVPDDLIPYLISRSKNVTYTVMIDWDRYDLDYLPEYDGRSIDAVRVVFPHGRHVEGVDVGRNIRNKGYKVFFQAANTLAYTDEELKALAQEVNKVRPAALSVVDTFGAMYEEDLFRIVDVLDKYLLPDIRIGFHSHNNQSLSFALTIAFIKYFGDKSRNIMVDASLCGMGRGAGNATTELVTSYLNRKCGGHYNIDAVLDAIDIYMGWFQERYRWGYSTPYFIAGLYCCHVNNIAYLLNNHRTTAKDMRNIIGSMTPEDRRKYDYDLLEQKYLEVASRKVDDLQAMNELQEKFTGRNILLIAPGKSSLGEQERIRQYIRDNNSVVIGVNAIILGYDYDYVFFVNPARYEYARETSGKDFARFRKIVLSNIKSTPEGNEIIIAYDHAIKQGWPHFDNAMICALRLMDWLGLHDVSVAGFDGFRTQYNESYADPYLPSLNPDNKWAELNEEVREMFIDFKRNAKTCSDIEFVTRSYFNDKAV